MQNAECRVQNLENALELLGFSADADDTNAQFTMHKYNGASSRRPERQRNRWMTSERGFLSLIR